MAATQVTNSNRTQVIYSIAKGDADKAMLLEKMSNDELQELLSNPDKTNQNNTAAVTSNDNVFSGNIKNSNFYSMDGLVLERTNFSSGVEETEKGRETQAAVQNQTEPVFYSNSQNIDKISDEEVLEMWNSMPKFVQDLYYTYLNNLDESERIEAEKGFLDNIKDFFSQGFKLYGLSNAYGAKAISGEEWQNDVKEVFTTDLQKKLKKDEKNIKQLANLSVNFEENIDEIKSLLKDIFGIDATDEEIRANKDKLLQVAELSQNFDGNIAQITDIFKEMTGIDLLEEDLLKNKESIDKLNEKSKILEEQYENIKAKYKEITGKELTDEEFEKLLNGESEVDNEEFNALMQEYLQGYEEFADVASDVVSGVASFGAFVSGTAAGGPAAGYAAAVATGAGIKYAMKKGNAANKSEGYQTGASDLVTGGVGGLFNAIAPQVGSAATRAVFNRGGKVLLEKVAMKASNKSLPSFLNKAVSLDNKYLGASKAQNLAARYMQASVEGTVSITPYNVATELMADEEHKQGWENVAQNSVIGGVLFGPIMDLGFRSIGKFLSKPSSDAINISFDTSSHVQIGSPASAAAYKNIEALSATEYNVNIGGKTVKVKIPADTTVDPVQLYVAACKKTGINSEEEILKTLGLSKMEMCEGKEAIKNFLNNSKDYDDVIVSATDGKELYNVKINDDGTVTVTSFVGEKENFAMNTTTMSMDEFVEKYEITAYQRETLPEYLSDENLDKLADKSNILISRTVTDDASEEVLVESINKENKTVTVKTVTSDGWGNFKTEKTEMSYDDFVAKFQCNRQLDDVLNYIHNIAQKYNFDEPTLREYVFKGLDINHPVFKDEKTTVAYIQDFFNTANLKQSDGSPTFSVKKSDARTGQVYTVFDTEGIQYATALKYSNPELKNSIDKLISLVQNGSISSKEMRNIATLLDYGVVSETTMDKVLNNPNFIKDGKVKLTSLIDDVNTADRSQYLNKLEKLLGSSRYNELKQILGDDLNKVQWELTDGMNANEILKFVEDIKNIHKLKSTQNMPENFFIDIEGYGKDMAWANSMQQTTDYASSLIKKGKSLDEVLSSISGDTRQLDLSNVTDPDKVTTSGILRENMPRWQRGAHTPYTEDGKYGIYKDRFDKLMWKNEKQGGLHNPYPDMELTRIGSSPDGPCMMHPPYSKAALQHVDDIYQEIQQKYMGKKLTQADLKEINEKVAEMHWILAHSMPWARGSDCIANAFVKSVYEALGIKTYPPAKNVSFDLEAFCTELSDYKKKYSSYYSKPPEIAQ